PAGDKSGGGVPGAVPAAGAPGQLLLPAVPGDPGVLGVLRRLGRHAADRAHRGPGDHAALGGPLDHAEVVHLVHRPAGQGWAARAGRRDPGNRGRVMLLHRLVEYASVRTSDVPPFHRERVFDWQLELNEDGTLADRRLTPLVATDPKGKARGVLRATPSAV